MPGREEAEPIVASRQSRRRAGLARLGLVLAASLTLAPTDPLPFYGYPVSCADIGIFRAIGPLFPNDQVAKSAPLPPCTTLMRVDASSGFGATSFSGAVMTNPVTYPGFVAGYSLTEIVPSQTPPVFHLDTDPAGVPEGANPLLDLLDDGTMSPTFPYLNHEIQSPEQQRCVKGLNRNLARVARARNRTLRKCLQSHVTSGESAQVCVAAPDRKVERAIAKTAILSGRRCTGALTDIGPGAAAAASTVELGLGRAVLYDLFGPELDPVIEPRAAEGEAAKCQLAAARRARRCERVRLREFNRCIRRGLENGTIRATLDLEACIGDDPKGRIARVCDPAAGDLDPDRLPQRCMRSGVDLSDAFPGCGADDFGTVGAGLDEIVACRVCRVLHQANGLSGFCASCPQVLHHANGVSVSGVCEGSP